MSSEVSSPKSWFLSFWEHVDELVRRLKVVLVALIVTISVGWLPTSIVGFSNPFGNYEPLLSLVMVRLKTAFLPSQATLIAGGMADPVFAMMYLSVIIGFLLASPIIFYEVLAFVTPGLYDNEKKVVGYYLAAFIGLLAVGACMAYFLIIPISFRILVYFTLQTGSAPFILVRDFYNWIFTLFVICGVFYTVPVFIVMLVQAGILPMKYLRGRNKIIAYVVILMAFWIFGPDPTPLTGLIMLAPFVVVFEAATYLGGRIERSRKARKALKEAAEGYRPATGFVNIGGGPKCRFCRSPLKQDTAFCPQCQRAVK